MDPNRIPRALALILISSGLLVAVPGEAARLDRLYQASVPVADRDADVRRDGFRRALEAVLVRVTGDRETAALILKEDALADPQTYVQQYGYERRVPDILERLPRQAESPSGDAPEGMEEEPLRPELHLNVRFDPRAVSRALSRAGLPQWGPERPQVLLWLAVEDEGRRRLLATSDRGPLSQTAAAVSRARGLPIVLPLMDLEDQRTVEVADVWAGFEDRVLTASERYDSQGVLMVRLGRIATDAWRARVRWFGPSDEESSWEVDGPGAPITLADALESLADRLGETYALVADPQAVTRVRIHVTGVADFEDFGRLEAYLRDLSPVQSVELLAYEADGLRYELATRGDPVYLEQAIALGNVLVRVADERETVTPHPEPWTVPVRTDQSPEAPGMLRYRLRP